MLEKVLQNVLKEYLQTKDNLPRAELSNENIERCVSEISKNLTDTRAFLNDFKFSSEDTI